MTSPRGYQRAGASAGPVAQALWDAVRARRDKIWTVDEIAEAAGTSDRSARRFVRALVEADVVIEVSAPAQAERFEPGSYKLGRDLGPLAPRLLRSARDSVPIGIADRNSDMSAGELKQLRRAAGLTLAQLARSIGYRDTRTVRHWEAGDRPIPAAIAERIRALVAA